MCGRSAAGLGWQPQPTVRANGWLCQIGDRFAGATTSVARDGPKLKRAMEGLSRVTGEPFSSDEPSCRTASQSSRRKSKLR